MDKWPAAARLVAGRCGGPLTHSYRWGLQLLHHAWGHDPACTREDWRREAGWPADFAFSYGEFEPDTDLASLIEALETEVARKSAARPLKDWQYDLPDAVYPYDFEADHRRGEVSVLVWMIERLLDQDTEVILVPLSLYGYELDRAELLDFASRFSRNIYLFDLYGDISSKFDPLWYDDAHVERSPVGELTTALMARRLLRSRALAHPPSGRDG